MWFLWDIRNILLISWEITHRIQKMQTQNHFFGRSVTWKNYEKKSNRYMLQVFYGKVRTFSLVLIKIPSYSLNTVFESAVPLVSVHAPSNKSCFSSPLQIICTHITQQHINYRKFLLKQFWQRLNTNLYEGYFGGLFHSHFQVIVSPCASKYFHTFSLNY